MKAYAILDGGGVKGAALAGCLKAAEELDIEFEGYGGTSAGSLVALFAAVGYTPYQIYTIMTEELDFTYFLDDDGDLLNRFKHMAAAVFSEQSVRKWFTLLSLYSRNARLLRDFASRQGIYRAKRLEQYILKKLQQAHPELKDKSDITFDDLDALQCKLLKIVASDIIVRSAAVFSHDCSDYGQSVITAVRASTCYPFLFCPVEIHHRRLVDGGLSSNLPVFLFEEERKKSRLPVVAFDLVSSKTAVEREQYNIYDFCMDMIDTSLEASDDVIRKITDGLYHVRIELPRNINTLDFNISVDERKTLFEYGKSQTLSYFSRRLPQWKQATDRIEQLQALHGPSKLLEPVLQALSKQVQEISAAQDIRSNIMLPTGSGTRVVVYQLGMDEHPDVDMELSMDAGCSGHAWNDRRPVVADLVKLRSDFALWGMTRSQQNKVPQDRKAMVSIPIFDVPYALSSGTIDLSSVPVIGTLSVDSSTPLGESQWINLDSGEPNPYLLDALKAWADVVGKLLL